MASSRDPLFRSGRSGLAKVVGPLEAELLECLWTAGEPLTARAVADKADTTVKYITVVTVLNNLAKKGLVRRAREGRALVFEPIGSRDEFLRDESDKVVRGLLDLSPRIAVNAFVGNLSAVSNEVLEELQAELTKHLTKTQEDGDTDATE